MLFRSCAGLMLAVATVLPAFAQQPQQLQPPSSQQQQQPRPATPPQPQQQQSQPQQRPATPQQPQQRPATPQPAATTVPAPKPAAPITGAVLQGLDKLVARVQEIDVPLNKDTKFGTLQIIVRQCTVSPPEAPPEASAFLEITEQRPGEEAKKVFGGWMFASSPALSAMEHPIYDVWVVGCKTSDSAEPVKSR